MSKTARRKLRRLARKAGVRSKPMAQKPPPSHPQREDSWSYVRRMVNRLAAERGEWAGYPLPDDHLELVVEPSHPLYKTLDNAKLSDERGPTDEALAMVAKAFQGDSIHPINWWMTRDGREVWVYHNGNGRSKVAVIPDRRDDLRLRMALNTLAASTNWETSAEETAVRQLFTLIPEHKQRSYITSGAFVETSQRSGVTYIFRRGRPTLALRLTPEGTIGKFLAALCLHPIAYYKDSWAGAMVPSDEVISHLLLMRGDEKFFWRKANQHGLRDIGVGL